MKGYVYCGPRGRRDSQSLIRRTDQASFAKVHHPVLIALHSLTYEIRACTESLKDLGGATAINLAAQAVSVLEDDECLNAGENTFDS